MGADPTTTGHCIECANNNALMRCCWWFNDYMPSVCADAAARWLYWLVMKWTWWSSVLWADRIGSESFVGEQTMEHGCELQWWWWWLQGNHTANSLYSWTHRKLHSIAKNFVIAIECPSFCLLLQSLCLLSLLGYKRQWCRVYVIITLRLSATVQFTTKEISRLCIQVHLCSVVGLKCSLRLVPKTMVC